MLIIGNENSARSFSDRSFFSPPSGHGRLRLRVMHGCPHRNACFFVLQDFEGLAEVFAPGRPPGYPCGRPRDIRPQNFANPPACYRSLSGPSGPKCPGSVPQGVLGPNLSGPGLRSVQKVSRECPRSVLDTFLTLRGHSQDTFGTLRSPGPGPKNIPKGTLRAKNIPRHSCSRPRDIRPQNLLFGLLFAFRS